MDYEWGWRNKPGIPRVVLGNLELNFLCSHGISSIMNNTIWPLVFTDFPLGKTLRRSFCFCRVNSCYIKFFIFPKLIAFTLLVLWYLVYFCPIYCNYSTLLQYSSSLFLMLILFLEFHKLLLKIKLFKIFIFINFYQFTTTTSTHLRLPLSHTRSTNTRKTDRTKTPSEPETSCSRKWNSWQQQEEDEPAIKPNSGGSPKPFSIFYTVHRTHLPNDDFWCDVIKRVYTFFVRTILYIFYMHSFYNNFIRTSRFKIAIN